VVAVSFPKTPKPHKFEKYEKYFAAKYYLLIVILVYL
jgi:hypothetical protein